MHLPRDIVINRTTRHRRRRRHGLNVCKEPSFIFGMNANVTSTSWWILRINRREKSGVEVYNFLDGSNFIRTSRVVAVASQDTECFIPSCRMKNREVRHWESASDNTARSNLLLYLTQAFQLRSCSFGFETFDDIQFRDSSCNTLYAENSFSRSNISLIAP